MCPKCCEGTFFLLFRSECCSLFCCSSIHHHLLALPAGARDSARGHPETLFLSSVEIVILSEIMYFYSTSPSIIPYYLPIIKAPHKFIYRKRVMPTSADLFKKFTLESVAQIATSKLKDQKEVRSKLADEYPMLADFWEELLPKGEDILIIRCHDQVHCIARQSSKPEVLFFNHHGGFYYPHLRLLHKYPFILKSHQVDIGGCRFVVSGANIMCQGLTSAGGRIQDNMDEDDLVAIYIEGKDHAVAVGKMMMSSDDIREKNKGPCIENVHHMGDGLWINYQLSASHIGGGASAIRPEDAAK